MTAAFKQIALEVAAEIKPGRHYVSLCVDHAGDEKFEYVIWTTIGGEISRNRLACEHTDKARLTAHLTGFVENVKGLPA